MSCHRIMGGAIPLQEPANNAVFPFPHPENAHTLWVNSGRAAFHCLLQALPSRPERVWLPRFICHTLLQATERLKLATEFYSIDEQLCPILPAEITARDAVVLVNYFGLTGSAIEQAAKQLPCPALIDATTAFYSPPPEGIAAFYSPRKFTGLADGGIAVAPSELRIDLPANPQSDNLSELLLRDGTQDAVQRAEDALNTPPMRMGNTTRRLMLATDWEKAAQARLRNYHTLHRALAGINRLNLPDTPQHAPMCYPLVSGIPELRDSLIDQGVRLPLYWQEVIETTDALQTENRLARTLLPLPLDQRYGEDDMRQLIRMILE